MNILLMTIPVSITLGIIFVLFFLAAVKSDQFEDLETPAHLPLSDDEPPSQSKSENQNINNNSDTRGEKPSGN